MSELSFPTELPIPTYRRMESLGCIVTGGILIVAALGKLLEISFDLNSFKHDPTLFIVLAVVELWIGGTLLLGKAKFKSAAWVFAAVLGVGFVSNAVYGAVFAGTFSECNCLGVFQAEWVSPIVLLGGYFFGLAISFHTLVSKPLIKTAADSLRENIVSEVAVLAAAFIVLNVSLTSQAGREILGLPTTSTVQFLDCVGDDCGVKDLGTVFSGKEYDYTFRLKNFGLSEVEILGSWVSCGCTTVILERQTLRPGQTINIPLKFQAPKGSGPLVAKLRVYLGDAEVSNVTARLVCKVTEQP